MEKEKANMKQWREKLAILIEEVEAGNDGDIPVSEKVMAKTKKAIAAMDVVTTEMELCDSADVDRVRADSKKAAEAAAQIHKLLKTQIDYAAGLESGED